MINYPHTILDHQLSSAKSFFMQGKDYTDLQQVRRDAIQQAIPNGNDKYYVTPRILVIGERGEVIGCLSSYIPVCHVDLAEFLQPLPK